MPHVFVDDCCAASLLVVSHTAAEAEIGRVSIDKMMRELYAAKRATNPDRTEISFPIDELVSMLPGMARVVLADGTKPRPANVKAIFAVTNPVYFFPTVRRRALNCASTRASTAPAG